MLNPTLYEALSKTFGEVLVSNSDDPGIFRQTRPYKDILVTTKKFERKNYADVLRPWGECYRINCPVCGDTKHRLYVNYLCGSKLKVGNRWVNFSNRLFYCQRRHCNALSHLRQVDAPWGELKPIATPQKQALRERQTITVKMPSPVFPIISEQVPEEVYAYLMKRRFDPERLWRKWQVYYAPAGAVWRTKVDDKTGEEYEVKFRYPRLIIPIFRGYHMVSWQARIACDDFPDSVPKYINCPDGINKSELLYNMDAAKWHTQVAIVEGVTDVWRIGDNAVCAFGKGMQAGQMRIVDDLWGHHGWGVIIPDGDDKDAILKAAKLQVTLNEKKLFGGGCTRINPVAGKDPGDLTEELLQKWIKESIAAWIVYSRGKK